MHLGLSSVVLPELFDHSLMLPRTDRAIDYFWAALDHPLALVDQFLVGDLAFS